MRDARTAVQRQARGFSLLEVLLATFILGIGLIMVASVFPVGANWTREGTQNSVAQTIALNALSVIQGHYGPGSLDPIHGPGATGGGARPLSGLGTAISALPGFVDSNGIPLAERCYQFGNAQPFPASNPGNCVYYWTALGRQTPGSGGASHDIYIFVFRKGDPNQTFTRNFTPPNATTPTGATGYVPFQDSSSVPYPEVAGLRDTIPTLQSTPPTLPVPAYYPLDPPPPVGIAYYNWAKEPTLVSGPYHPGTYLATANPPVTGAFPPIGYIGVGVTSGTVFRQGLNIDYTTITNTSAIAQPNVAGSPPNYENIIFAPNADDAPGSPLIYVYQTTVSY